MSHLGLQVVTLVPCTDVLGLPRITSTRCGAVRHPPRVHACCSKREPMVRM